MELTLILPFFSNSKSWILDKKSTCFCWPVAKINKSQSRENSEFGRVSTLSFEEKVLINSKSLAKITINNKIELKIFKYLIFTYYNLFRKVKGVLVAIKLYILSIFIFFLT